MEEVLKRLSDLESKYASLEKAYAVLLGSHDALEEENRVLREENAALSHGPNPTFRPAVWSGLRSSPNVEYACMTGVRFGAVSAVGILLRPLAAAKRPVGKASRPARVRNGHDFRISSNALPPRRAAEKHIPIKAYVNPPARTF